MHDLLSHEHPSRTRKTKRPRFGDPRAFALPREIGVTDLRERIRSIDKINDGQMPSIVRAQQRIAFIARRQTDLCEAMRHDKTLE